MQYINLVGWIAFSEVIMGSLVGLLKVVVISMLGWFVTRVVPAMGQSKDAIEVVVITMDSDLTAELMTKSPVSGSLSENRMLSRVIAANGFLSGKGNQPDVL